MGESAQSPIIKLHTLEKEFEVTTAQYEESYQTYITILSDEANNPKKLIVIDGTTFWGEHGLTEQSMGTIDECIDMCITNDKCSGATFNSDKKYCWLRSGDNKLMPGTTADAAIVSEKMQLIENLKFLNDHLIEINAEITDLMKQIIPSAQEEYAAQQQKQANLEESAKLLQTERLLIDDMLSENNKYANEVQNNLLTTTKTNVQLNYWMLFTIIIILILIKTILGRSMPFKIIFWIIIWILLFLLTFNIKTLSGFLTWGILVLIIILMMLKIIPSP